MSKAELIIANVSSICNFTQCLPGHWLIPPPKGTQAPRWLFRENLGSGEGVVEMGDEERVEAGLLGGERAAVDWDGEGD